MCRNRDGSVGVVTCYAFYGRGSVPGKSFSLLHSVQTGYGAYPAFYSMDTGGSFPWVKTPRSEAYHSHLTSAEIMVELYLHTPIRLHAVVLN
jgi:hypothetical protein